MVIKNLLQDQWITLDSYLKYKGVQEVSEYIAPSDKYIEPYYLYQDIPYGCKEIEVCYKTYGDEAIIYIIQDGDTDGICSTLILYEYLSHLNENWKIRILLHTAKQRGLDDENIMNEIRLNRPHLVIVPDAGTNNINQANELCELGVSLIVIDHHDYDTPIQKGVLINNQNSLYKVQRNGSGALVTHKFLYGLDKTFEKDWAGWFIDLVALSLISDSMDMSEMENRAYYYYGLQYRDCINNEFLGAMFDRFIGDKLYTQKQIAFNIIPKLNAVCRHSNQEYKQMLLMGFLGMEDINTVLDMCEQCHTEQREIVSQIIENNQDYLESLNDNIIFFASDDIPRSYSGLVCGKVMNICDGKPSIVGSIKDGYFIGSLRSPIPLRSELNNNSLVDFASGHEDSCGFGIKEENIKPLIDYYNTLELSYDPCIEVLNSYGINSIPNHLFGLFEPYSQLWGKGIEKPQFCIEDIKFNPKDVKILGNNKRVLKITPINSRTNLIIFNCKKEDKINLGLGYYNEQGEFIEERSQTPLCMKCVGELTVNEYKGYTNNQIIIQNYEVAPIAKRSLQDLL